MRASRLTLSALALGLGLVGAALVSAPAQAESTPSPTASMSMPGMDMSSVPGTTAAAPVPDRASAIARARLKPVFLQAKLEGRNEVPVPGKPPVGDPKGRATGLIR